MPGDAQNEIKNVWMKPDKDINSHITKFVTLLSESRLDKNSLAVVNFFKETLAVKLQVRIMNLENPPKDINGWYKWAKQIDNTAKRTRAIVGKLLQNLKTNKLAPWYYFPSWECNLNAMDVDALSIEERGRLMKEGKCFGCKKSGHLAKDCLNKDDWDDRKKEDPKKKWEEKKLYSFIQNIYQDMDNEEK